MTLNLRRSGALLGAAALFSLATVPAAHAALKTATTLSSNSAGAAPAIETGATGAALASWRTYPDGFFVATRDPGQNWSADTRLSTPSLVTNYSTTVVDDDGRMTAVWEEHTVSPDPMDPMMDIDGPATMYTATRTAGGSWSAPEQLSANGTNANGPEAIAAGPDGSLVVLWRNANSTTGYATRTASGAWTKGTTGFDVGYGQLLVAVGTDGTATTAWRDPNNSHAMSSTLPSGGAWSAPVDVSGGFGGGFDFDMNDAGDATLVFNNGSFKIFATRRSTTNGSWSAPVQISINGGGNYYWPTVTVDDAGRAYAGWPQFGTSQYDAMVSTRGANGSWSGATSLGSTGSSGLEIEGNADGDVYAVFPHNSKYVMAEAHNGGAWSATTDLDDIGIRGSHVAVDGAGDAVFTGASNTYAPLAQAVDNAGPALNALNVPATAETGTAASFAVSPLDTWSALGTVTWDFGDGATANGNAVTHAYATTGAKTVTITATDALGNTTTRTRGVTVTAGSTTPPPPADDTTPPTSDPTPPTTTTPPPTTTTPPAPCATRTVTVKWTLPKGTKVRRQTIAVSGQKLHVIKNQTRSVKLTITGALTRVNVYTRTTKGKLVKTTRTFSASC